MNLTFDLAEPEKSDLACEWTLWGTYYYGQPAVESATSVEIRNREEQPIGPKISQKNWCRGRDGGNTDCAKSDGESVTYNFDGTASARQTSCKAYFSKLSNRNRGTGTDALSPCQGYFFAADVGGAIKGTHVDFFLGTSLVNPFQFVKSDDSSTFVAREVCNQATVLFLRGLHQI